MPTAKSIVPRPTLSAKRSSRRAVPLNPWGKAVIAMQGGEPIHIGPLRKNVVG